MPNKLISLDDAADRLGLSVWTLRHWCSSRKIRSFKVGARRLVAVEDIDALIAANVREADPRVSLPTDYTAALEANTGT